MLVKSLVCGSALAFCSLALVGLHSSDSGCPGARILALACPAASTDDTANVDDKPALSGVWVLSGGEMKIEFARKDVMKLFPHGESEVIIVVCQYAAGKDDTVKAKITGLEGEAKEKVQDMLPVGLEFSFKWSVKNGAATLKEVKGDDVDLLKAHLEGDYSRKD
jgi:hypothetical protein